MQPGNRVQKTAEEFGNQANRLSKAIRNGRRNLVGTVSFSSVAEIATKTEAQLPRIINAEGFDYISIDVNWHGGNVERVMNELIKSRVEGVVISHMAHAFGPQYTQMLDRVGIPAVAVYGDEKLGIPLVAEDARSAFFTMTRHLQSLGHRRLLLLVNTYDSRPSLQRIEGFQQAMRNHGPCQIIGDSCLAGLTRLPWSAEESGLIVRVNLVRSGHSPMLGFYGAAKRIFSMSEVPNAILCFNDIAAFSVFTAAFENGLRIPTDVALTGCDNDMFGRFDLYGLTTIEKDVEGACEAAVDILVDNIKTGKRETRSRIFPSTLVLRRSCGRVPGEGAQSVERATASIDALF